VSTEVGCEPSATTDDIVRDVFSDTAMKRKKPPRGGGSMLIIRGSIDTYQPIDGRQSLRGLDPGIGAGPQASNRKSRGPRVV
jgi:hypothetical protein